MATRLLTILTGRNREPEPSIINEKEKTIADFTRVVEQTGTLLGIAPSK
jgi:hypothetical protein